MPEYFYKSETRTSVPCNLRLKSFARFVKQNRLKKPISIVVYDDNGRLYSISFLCFYIFKMKNKTEVTTL